jgi:hypothetical protein
VTLRPSTYFFRFARVHQTLRVTPAMEAGIAVFMVGVPLLLILYAVH